LRSDQCFFTRTSLKNLKKVVIPEDILQGLANALATTPEGIKQRRKRLLHRLRAYLENA
jgi:hypothetical protein